MYLMLQLLSGRSPSEYHFTDGAASKAAKKMRRQEPRPHPMHPPEAQEQEQSATSTAVGPTGSWRLPTGKQLQRACLPYRILYECSPEGGVVSLPSLRSADASLLSNAADHGNRTAFYTLRGHGLVKRHRQVQKGSYQLTAGGLAACRDEMS